MLSMALLFLGQFALFTDLRPFLETVTGLDIPALSLVLLITGGAGLIGTWLIGIALRTQLYSVLIAMPLAMAAIALALTVLGGVPFATGALLFGWGLIGAAAPVGWWTWLSKVLPDDSEAGGGLMVAVIQLAIATGATIGGVPYRVVIWWRAHAAWSCTSSLSGDASFLVLADRCLSWHCSTPNRGNERRHEQCGSHRKRASHPCRDRISRHPRAAI